MGKNKDSHFQGLVEMMEARIYKPVISMKIPQVSFLYPLVGKSVQVLLHIANSFGALDSTLLS
jgi:hypothetical protein